MFIFRLERYRVLLIFSAPAVGVDAVGIVGFRAVDFRSRALSLPVTENPLQPGDKYTDPSMGPRAALYFMERRNCQLVVNPHLAALSRLLFASFLGHYAAFASCKIERRERFPTQMRKRR